MKFSKFFAFVVFTIGAVLHLPSLPALSYFAYSSIIEDACSCRETPVAVNVFRLERAAVLFCPEFCYSSSFGIVIRLGSFESWTIRTRYSTVGYDCFHLHSSCSKYVLGASNICPVIDSSQRIRKHEFSTCTGDLH